MRPRLLVLLAALAVPLAGCSGTSAPAPQTPSQSSPRPLKTLTVRTPAAVRVTTATVPTMFSLAGGNTGCDVEPAYARCDLRAHAYALPPEPADCASGWGHGIQMQLGSKAEFFCGSDSVLGGTRVLAVGQGLKVADLECDVVAAGTVRCHSDLDGHGFTVSRASYQLR